MKLGPLSPAKFPGFWPTLAMNLALPLILSLIVLPPRTVPQVAQPSPQVRELMLVSTKWLAGHLTDAAGVILHVARGRAGYDPGTIPGARFLAVDPDTVPHDKGSHELASAEATKKSVASP